VSIAETFNRQSPRHDQARTEAIASEVRDAFAHGRKVLVLTERTERLDATRADRVRSGRQ